MCLSVEPVSNVAPHAQRTFAKLYCGWIFSFMGYLLTRVAAAKAPMHRDDRAVFTDP
jgi:hypothetical protein